MATTETKTEGEAHGTTEGAAATTTHTEQAGGEHGSVVFPPLDQSTFPSQIFWLILTFGALYALMKWLLPKIGGTLEARKNRIDGDLARAQSLKDETEAAVKSYEKALADARAKANDIARETRESVTKDIDARQAAINATLSQKINEAEARISASKAKAMSSVHDIAAESAADIIAALGGGNVTRAAIDKAIKG
jgi:F-type H+-transporting ATPase subunit b